MKDLLEGVGIGLRYFPATDKTDTGGLLKEQTENQKVVLVLGVQFVAENRDIRITTVYDNGAAQKLDCPQEIS